MCCEVIFLLFVYLFINERQLLVIMFLVRVKNNFNIITCLETILLPRMNYANHKINLFTKQTWQSVSAPIKREKKSSPYRENKLNMKFPCQRIYAVTSFNAQNNHLKVSSISRILFLSLRARCLWRWSAYVKQSKSGRKSKRGDVLFSLQWDFIPVHFSMDL